MVLDGDLANSTKADKFALAHPHRFFQMGIAEQNLIGVAAGCASVGYVPWTSSFTVFFTHRALDPIRMLVAQSHANVKIVASYSGLLIGAVGKTHLDVQDLAIMRAMPDMAVLAPADEAELLAMMDWAAGPRVRSISDWSAMTSRTCSIITTASYRVQSTNSGRATMSR